MNPVTALGQLHKAALEHFKTKAAKIKKSTSGLPSRKEHFQTFLRLNSENIRHMSGIRALAERCTRAETLVNALRSMKTKAEADHLADCITLLNRLSPSYPLFADAVPFFQKILDEVNDRVPMWEEDPIGNHPGQVKGFNPSATISQKYALKEISKHFSEAQVLDFFQCANGLVKNNKELVMHQAEQDLALPSREIRRMLKSARHGWETMLKGPYQGFQKTKRPRELDEGWEGICSIRLQDKLDRSYDASEQTLIFSELLKALPDTNGRQPKLTAMKQLEAAFPPNAQFGFDDHEDNQEAEEISKIMFHPEARFGHSNTFTGLKHRGKKIWVNMPIGDSQERPDDKSSAGISFCPYKVKYRQGSNDTCVVDSFASGLHHFGHKNLASAFHGSRIWISQLDGATQMKTLKQKFLDEVPRSVWRNITLFLKDQAAKKIDLNALPPHSMMLVVPLAWDGGTQHALVVVNKDGEPPMIIDSNEDKFMAISKGALDRCCGPEGYARVKMALLIELKRD